MAKIKRPTNKMNQRTWTHRIIGMSLLWLVSVVPVLAADATAAPNGDGQFKSIHDAIMAAPQGPRSPGAAGGEFPS